MTIGREQKRQPSNSDKQDGGMPSDDYGHTIKLPHATLLNTYLLMSKGQSLRFHANQATTLIRGCWRASTYVIYTARPNILLLSQAVLY